MDETQVDITWAPLKDAIKAIMLSNTSGLSFEQLYRKAHNLVLHKHGEKLYTRLKEVVKEHMVNNVRRNVVSDLDSCNFLQTLNTAWASLQMSMMTIRLILMYLENVYVQENNVENVFDMGVIIFREQVIHFPPVHCRLQETLLEMVARERQGEEIDRLAMRNSCQMLMNLGIGSRTVYEEDFERLFLDHSAEFYKQESQKLLATNNVPVYVKRVMVRFAEEAERVQHCLDASTNERIVSVLEEELIGRHMRALVNMEHTGLVDMLQNNRMEDLNCMYKLFTRVPDGLQTMCACYVRYLREQGKAPVCNQMTAVGFIQSLLDWYDSFIGESITMDKLFVQLNVASLEYFLNINQNSPEYLSLFINDMLKKRVKMVTPQDMEVTLDKTMVLFRLLRDKDIFKRFYENHLAKRLLVSKNILANCEEIMIPKLKAECGCEFTFKMERMLKDETISCTTMDSFNMYLSQSRTEMYGVELSVQVLTTGFWPVLSSTPKANLPFAPRMAFETFKNFYLGMHSGRQLALKASLGTADLKATFFRSRKHAVEGNIVGPKDAAEVSNMHIIQVSTYQMIILLLFNKKEQWSYEDIKSESSIPEEDLFHALQTLTSGRSMHVLNKQPQTSDIESSHSFTVNDSFTSKQRYVKIQKIMSRKRGHAYERTVAHANEDRKHEIEAVIVRIMKARKHLLHKVLVCEAAKQLKVRFLARPAAIEKRIQNLLERDYLTRKLEDRQIFYSYVA